MNCFGWVIPQNHGAIGDGVHDDAPHFESAAVEAIASGKGLWIPPGKTYRIAGEVTCAGNAGKTLEIASSNATILCDAPANAIFNFTNVLRGKVRGLQFRGVEGRLTDCAHVIHAGACKVTVEDCDFRWIGSSWGMLQTMNGGLDVRRCGWHGSVSPMGLIVAGNATPASPWSWCTVEDCDVKDWGVIDGTTSGSKIGPQSWQSPFCERFVQLNYTVPIHGAHAHMTATIKRCWVDENIRQAVQAIPTLGAGKAPIHSLVIEDVQLSCSGSPGNDLPAFEIHNTEHLEIRRSLALPLGGACPQRDAIKLVNVQRTEVDGFRCDTNAAGVNRIAYDGDCGSIDLYDTRQGRDYRTLDGPPNVNIRMHS